MEGVERTDEELVEAIQEAPEGDLRSFDRLVERHRRQVMANCRYLTGSAADAEDLAQEVFVKAYFGIGRFEGRSRFKTWLQRIKANHCINYLDKRRKRRFVSVDEPGLETREELQIASRAERELVAGRERRRIGEVLDGMSEKLRVPLILRDADGLPYQEIAAELGIGLSAVKMRIKRAREEFRRKHAELLREAGGKTE